MLQNGLWLCLGHKKLPLRAARAQLCSVWTLVLRQSHEPAARRRHRSTACTLTCLLAPVAHRVPGKAAPLAHAPARTPGRGTSAPPVSCSPAVPQSQTSLAQTRIRRLRAWHLSTCAQVMAWTATPEASIPGSFLPELQARVCWNRIMDVQASAKCADDIYAVHVLAVFWTACKIHTGNRLILSLGECLSSAQLQHNHLLSIRRACWYCSSCFRANRHSSTTCACSCCEMISWSTSRCRGAPTPSSPAPRPRLGCCWPPARPSGTAPRSARTSEPFSDISLDILNGWV